jgi:hypothetical protein
MEAETVLVSGFHRGPHHQSGPAAISGKTNECATVELKSSHVSLVSHPREIANLILAAAGRTA